MKPSFDVDLEKIRQLASLANEHHLLELVFEDQGVTVHIARDVETRVIASDDAIVAFSDASAEPAPLPLPIGKEVPAPAVGVFYRSSNPETPPFVREGDPIEEGQVIGLIEAMKTFNEIPAPFAGIVLKVVAQNGQLVSEGDTLLVVDPAGGENEV